jgi:hypothetical protein
MALVRKRRIDDTGVLLARVAPQLQTSDPFGPRSEIYNALSNNFVFTQSHSVVNNLLFPAVALARKKNLLSEFDDWSNTALDTILCCSDLHSKKLLWVVLLGMLPEIEDWFNSKAACMSHKWTVGLYSRTCAFLKGVCVDDTQAVK